MKIKKLLMLLIVVFSIIPIVVITVLSLFEFDQRMQGLIKINVEDIAQQECHALKQFFDQREIALRVLSGLDMVRDELRPTDVQPVPEQRRVQQDDLNELLAARVQEHNYLQATMVVNRNGTVVAASEVGMIGVNNVLTEEDTTGWQEGQVSYSKPYSEPARFDGMRHIWVSLPIYDNAQYIGYISSAVSVDYFGQQLEGMHFVEGGDTVLVDEDGNVIAAAGEMRLTGDDFAAQWSAVDKTTTPEGFIEHRLDGRWMLSYYSTMSNSGWQMISTVEWNQMNGAAKQAANAAGIFLLVLLTLILSIYIMVTRRITVPIQTLTGAINRIDQGDTTARVDYAHKDEFGEISQAFNCMMDTLACNQEQLRISEERHRIVSEQSDSIIFEYNVTDGSCYHSANWERVFGSPAIVQNFVPQILSSGVIHPDDTLRFVHIFKEMPSNGQKSIREELRLQKADGSYLWCSVRATVIYDDGENPLKIIGRISDIDQRKKETEALKTSAQRDLLSGLYNKITTERMIDAFLRDEGTQGVHALFVIDIDNFKQINDQLGHLTGDRVIRESAEILSNIFRGGDVKGRIGGDELLVLVKEIGSEQSLALKAQSLVTAMRRTVTNETGREVGLSCSVGIALYPRDGNDYLSLFTKADAALYVAKERGKNRFWLTLDHE